MTAPDFLSIALFLTLGGPSLMLHTAVAYVRREPVTVATFVLAAVLVAVSLVTGVPVEALLVQVGAAAALFYKVRDVVSPVVKVVVHEDDLAESDEVAIYSYDEDV